MEKIILPSMQTTDFLQERSVVFFPFPARFVGGGPSVDRLSGYFAK